MSRETLLELLIRLRQAPGLLLMFDFDGTMIDIAPTPDAINVPPEFKILLRSLADIEDTNVAIVSGRSLPELQEYIPNTIPVALAGCHGGQLQMPGEVEESILDDEDIQHDLDKFAEDLHELADWPGIIIEHKGCAVALHYRLADATTIEHAREEFYSRAELLDNYEEMEVIEGKEVLEMRPAGVNKGIAVKFLVEHNLPASGSLAVYFGDDTTDLEAFEALPEENALRVAIGEKITERADFVLESPAELLQLVKELIE